MAPRVSWPASAMIVAAVATVTEPDQELVPLTRCKAPEDEMPEPFKVSGSAPTEMPPARRSSAPELTTVAPTVLPSAEVCCTSRTPLLTVVVPE